MQSLDDGEVAHLSGGGNRTVDGTNDESIPTHATPHTHTHTHTHARRHGVRGDVYDLRRPLDLAARQISNEERRTATHSRGACSNDHDDQPHCFLFPTQEKYLYQRRGQTRVGTLASLEQAKIQTHPPASPTRLFVMSEEPKGTFYKIAKNEHS